MSRARSIILLSGGLDSAANLAFCVELDQPVLCLTAHYGQRAALKEIEAAKAISRYYGIHHQTLDLRWLGELGGNSLTDATRQMPSPTTGKLDDLPSARETAKAVWVPNRNGILLNAAGAYAESLDCAQVVVGFNREEAATFPDNSADFLERASRSLELSTANHTHAACYTIDQDKAEIVSALTQLQMTFPFDMLWSCYEGGKKICARCESCQRSARAMASLGRAT
jgi:7-cyano-7-deazaguanine synthase